RFACADAGTCCGVWLRSRSVHPQRGVGFLDALALQPAARDELHVECAVQAGRGVGLCVLADRLDAVLAEPGRTAVVQPVVASPALSEDVVAAAAGVRTPAGCTLTASN